MDKSEVARASGKRQDKLAATRIPSHGKGRLMPAWGTPERPVPPGGGHTKPRTLRDVQRLARKESVDALISLVGCYKRPDGKIDRTADGRVVQAAASTVLTWAFGKAPDYDPNREKPAVKFDLSGLSIEEKRLMLRIMAKTTMTETTEGDDVEEDDGPTFDASRFATEPLTIEPGDADLPAVYLPQEIAARLEGSAKGVAVRQAKAALAAKARAKAKKKADRKKAMAGYQDRAGAAATAALAAKAKPASQPAQQQPRTQADIPTSSGGASIFGPDVSLAAAAPPAPKRGRLTLSLPPEDG